MSQVFQDTPNYYTTALQGRYWNVVHADAEVTADAGRFGSGDDAWTGTSEDAYRLKYVRQPALQTQFAIGKKIKIDAFPAAAKVLLAVTDGAAGLQTSFVLNTDGTVSIHRGNAAGTVIAGPSAAAVPDGVYLDIGLKGDISNASGFAEAWVGESGDLSTWAVACRVSGVNTQGASGADWRGVYSGDTDETQSCHLYARNGLLTDGLLTDLSPGHWTDVKFPNAPGSHTNWSVSPGGAIDDALDDAAANDDTDYAYTAQQDDPYSVEVADLDAGALVVYSCDVVATVRNFSGFTDSYAPIVVTDRDDAAARATFVRPWQSVTDGAWAGIDECVPINPVTGVAWTPDEVRETEWGGQATA